MRILVGMSGGFDSAYAANKLLAEGHRVEGAVLVMHEYTEVNEARACAEKLGIPLHTVDCRESFNKVKEYFVREYSGGRTPNPCIYCNREVKMAALAEYAVKNGFDRIATGHYAAVREFTYNGKTNRAIAEALDKSKDQSYMLYGLSREVLDLLVLPMADEVKSELRSNDANKEVFAFDRPESQEICFLPDGNYAGYVESITGAFPEGDFIDGEGNILGKHKGLVRYTLGQRKGLGIAAESRLYVAEIDRKLNTVTLLPSPPTSTRVEIEGIIYSGIEPHCDDVSINVSVRLRYRARLIEAVALLRTDNTATLVLSEPFAAVTPGQSAVAYIDGTVVFGGIIKSSY